MKERKSKVLIVDDIPSNLNYVCDVLHEEGLELIVTTNGMDAIKIAQEKIPDLILLDIAMPKMDGFETCQLLKSDPATREIPIVFLTARSEDQDVIKGFEVGAVDYIQKPFNTSELTSRVLTHINLKIKTEELKNINLTLEEKVAERTFQLQESYKNLKEVNDKLTSAHKELTKLDRIKSEFIRHINHEMRTPLQGIHGFTRIMEETSLTEEQKEYLTSIDMLVNRLVKVTELSLLFTELKMENYKIILKEINVIECIRKASDDYKNNNKNIEIILDNKEENITIKSDYRLLITCINIVLDNAIKYSDKNSKVIFKVLQNDNNIIEIQDKGPGFSKKALNNLFELFAADNLNHGLYGFGVGLATAKLILNLLEGKIEATNLKTGGAKVSIVLP